jgi:serine protease Do
VGDSVRVLVTRGEQTLVLRADLGDNIVPNTEDLEIKILSGEVSKRATYFPTVLQHDTILKPSDMGGPLVDLDGRVIGINIARAGRTETYALPADVVLAAMDRLKSGLFAPLPAKPVPEK